MREGAWFRGLPEPLQDAIVDRSVPRTYARGEVIAAQESPPAGLYAILEGRVAWKRSSGAEEGVLLYVGGPGAWFGHLALVRGTPAQFEVVAHTAARVLLLPRSEYQRLIAENPAHYQCIADQALERLELLIRLYAVSRSMAAEDLIPAQLATLAKLRRAESRQSTEGVELALSQAEVAAIFGVSRQTLNAALKRLQTEGLIEVGFRRLRIPDPARLPGGSAVAARLGQRSVGKPRDASKGHQAARRAAAPERKARRS